MDPDGAASGSAVTEDAPDLSVVMPVYNEGEAVEPVLRALDSAVRTPHEILVVYDFDGDTTVPVIVRLTPEIDGLRGLRNDLADAHAHGLWHLSTATIGHAAAPRAHRRRN